KVSDEPYANVYPDGRGLGVSRDVRATIERLGRFDPGDAAGWSKLDQLFSRLSGPLFELYGTAVGSPEMLKALVSAARQLGRHGIGELGQLVASSCRELADGYLVSDEAKALLACWGLHLDFGPDVSGGAMFPFLEAFADMHSGMSVVEGGASRLVDALVAMVEGNGGEVRTGVAVKQILVEGGRATGVVTEDGERHLARRAVFANVSPSALPGGLLEKADLGPRASDALGRYKFGPATMMLHLACSGPVPWAAGEEFQRYAYVHIAPYLDDLARTYASALAGELPREPLLVVGQTSAVDPSRAPDGCHLCWIQVRTLPTRITSDPDGSLAGSSWDQAAEEYADRVLAKLERYAPGLGALILDRSVWSPSALERWDRNLVGGDSIGGSMHLRQNFLFRPAPGMARYRLPIKGLRLVGAGTWPGPGVNAGSGYLAARELLGSPRDRVSSVVSAICSRRGRRP
ncbi:MAG: phytoene desaturase family protein, partial [Acidimicrobiales bacterium]